MLQFEPNFVFARFSYRELHVMKPRRRRRTKIKWRNFRAAQHKWHCSTKRTLYVLICRVLDEKSASGRTNGTLRYRF